MEIDVFPVVPSDYLLPWAFDLMTSWNRAALVVKTTQSYSFVEAADIVIAMSERTTGVLEPLTKRTPLRMFAPQLPSGSGLDFGDPGTGLALEQFMDSAGESFVLLAVTGTRAVVASRHEDKMPNQAGPKDCYCRTDLKSVVPGMNGDNCPHDHRHVGTVRCR